MPEEPDRALLRRFVEGDQDAFETLFRQFQPEVYRWTLSIVRDVGSAEDVVIETFWRAYKGRARFDPSRTFGAWMRRIATNAACDYLQTMRHSLFVKGRQVRVMGSISNPDPELRNTIELVFRHLKPDLQVVATLALIEERPYAEIADALDLRLGTVKSRLSRAVQKLRKELARLGVQP